MKISYKKKMKKPKKNNQPMNVTKQGIKIYEYILRNVEQQQQNPNKRKIIYFFIRFYIICYLSTIRIDRKIGNSLQTN